MAYGISKNIASQTLLLVEQKKLSMPCKIIKKTMQIRPRD